jgi:hypothetical protein
MAEDKQDVEDSKANDPECRELELRRLDLEIGPGGFRSWLREQVLKVIFDNLPKGMKALGERIETGDVAILKYMFELALKLEDDREDQQMVLVSFAELLITELKSLPAETGDETGAEVPAGE